MKEHKGAGSQVDLHRFFEASLRVLQNDSQSGLALNRGNRALLQRSETDESVKKRAVANAAKALTALWKVQPLGKTI
jgi:hypothetical protein